MSPGEEEERSLRKRGERYQCRVHHLPELDYGIISIVDDTLGSDVVDEAPNIIRRLRASGLDVDEYRIVFRSSPDWQELKTRDGEFVSVRYIRDAELDRAIAKLKVQHEH